MPFRAEGDVGEWSLFLGGKTTIARFAAGLISALSNIDGVAIASSVLPWSMFEYKNTGYGLRKAEPPRRITVSGYQKAGIVAPSGGPTLADGGAGVLTAANYQAVSTFYNTATGAESNPSVVSNTLALPASRQIGWTGIPVSTNSQVNARRLYRVLPGQAGEYFFVGQINDNVTTTFTDNVAIADMGDSVSFDNGTPPTGLSRGVIWNERLFATDDTDIFFSEAFLPESFAEDSIIKVFPDDGHQITTLFPFGDRLIVGKTNKVHFLIGTDPSAFELRTLSDTHGCMVHETMKSAEGLIFWYGGDNFYRSDGVGVEAISSIKIRDLLARITSFAGMSAEVHPKQSLYICHVPLDGALVNTHSLVYNYKTDAWAVFEHPGGTVLSTTYSHISPSYMASFYTSFGVQILYSLFYDGHLYRYLDGEDDYGTDIEASFSTKAFGLALQGYLKACQSVSLLCTSIPDEDILLSLYSDFSIGESYPDLAIVSRHVSLEGSDRWKHYKLSNLRDPGDFVQLRGKYIGDPVLEIEGISLSVLELARRRRLA
jgi:hypothetical protein